MFKKTECGVDFLLNVLDGKQQQKRWTNNNIYNTNFFEISFFKKAKGRLLLDQRQVDISNNTVLFISPFQKRQWPAALEEPDFTTLIFQEDFLNDFFADKLFTYRLLYFYQLDYPLNMTIPADEMDRACHILQEIKTELTATKPDSAHIIRSLLYYLLQKLNRQYAHQHHLPIEKTENNYAHQFRKLLEVHIHEKQRISEYAALMGISRISLNKAVQAQFNVTATHLMKHRLLAEVQNYLLHESLTVAEIADKLNFSEPHHLMRFFKSQTGLTTGEFMASYQNSPIE
ncbi:helix-turn-helix domain-containing protein [Chitinophaga polysaccharea]|uniref:helix-turn-helix domain-containing protein n=1 Tax=Chitinophaga polysaccharea TaxID=1293035 RepID=UPI001B3B2CBB|nr:AraC family transcriptional regulator [Chitinophaga polysaccharea]